MFKFIFIGLIIIFVGCSTVNVINGTNTVDEDKAVKKSIQLGTNNE